MPRRPSAGPPVPRTPDGYDASAAFENRVVFELQNGTPWAKNRDDLYYETHSTPPDYPRARLMRLGRREHLADITRELKIFDLNIYT